MGLGLITVIKSLWWIKYPLYIFAGWIGFMEMFNGFKGKDWSPIPKRWKSSVEKGMRTILSPLGALIIGFFVGIVLLPCTSGPYVVALSVLSGMDSFIKFFILVLYNLIFVSPFIALTFLVPFGLSTMKLKKLKKSSTEVMEIITGGALLTLVIVSIIFGF
jgi:cytochrome c biogenesis protein CcdA